MAAHSATDTSGLNDVERLIAIEEIRRLKARYFRYVDTQQWSKLRDIFSKDATLFYPEFYESPHDYEVGISMIEEVLTGSSTMHQGFCPEIDITGPATAKGIWAMHDHVWFPADNRFGISEMIANGHYHETYEKRDGHWLITSLKLTRVRTVTVNAPRRVV